MRRDLRKLLARLRVGLVRAEVLVEAVEEARARLVSARFEDPPSLLETSIYARTFLGYFEREVSRAQMLTLEGDLLRTIRALEKAERLLEAARRMARAHQMWDDCRRVWAQLGDQPGFDALRELLTVRMAAAGLAASEALMAQGEPRQALFAAGLCRSSQERAFLRDPDEERRRLLVRKLIRLQEGSEGPPAALSSALGRLVDEGFLELAERFIDDWEIDATRFEGEGGQQRSRRHFEIVARMSETELEARTLAGILAVFETPAEPESP